MNTAAINAAATVLARPLIVNIATDPRLAGSPTVMARADHRAAGGTPARPAAMSMINRVSR